MLVLWTWDNWQNHITETDSHAEAGHMVGQYLWRHLMFGGSLNRTQWTVEEPEVGMLAQLNFSWSHLFTDLCFIERQSGGLSWSSVGLTL